MALPRVAVETEGMAAGEPSTASPFRQRPRKKGIREASSDILPVVFATEKSRLGGNMEYDSGTELPSSLSTDSRVREERGCLGNGSGKCGKTLLPSLQAKQNVPQSHCLLKTVGEAHPRASAASLGQATLPC